MPRTVRMLALVDWDCARRIVRASLVAGRDRLIDRATTALQDELAAVLTSRSDDIYRVSLRVYHGWFTGKTKTEDFRDLERYVAQSSSGRVINKISFDPQLQIADRLLCNTSRATLFDSLRTRPGTSERQQKMVDTAIVSDLLHAVRMKVADQYVVVGDDDDLLPGVFTAEAWGAAVLVGRLREFDSAHLDTTGLVVRLKER